MRQPWAWILWLIAVMVVLTVTRNPFYLLIGLGCIFFVELILQKTGKGMQRLFSPWKLTALIILLATIFNVLTSHYGGTVLFTIPGKLPLVSGNVTLEAIVYGGINGMILAGILMSFTVLNLALPVRDLISLIPRAFFPVAVVTSIAVTYLPTTMRQFYKIREAQSIRGHQMHTLRDWLPLLMPLLVGGLEHAMQLAEAMTARGFASSKPQAGGNQAYPRILMLLGVMVLASGWLIQLVSESWKGWLLILFGAGLVLLGLWLTGNNASRTIYRRGRWNWEDAVGIVGALVVISLSFLHVPGMGNETLFYDPYPLLGLPPFNPILGAAMMSLLIPGLLALKSFNPHNL